MWMDSALPTMSSFAAFAATRVSLHCRDSTIVFPYFTKLTCDKISIGNQNDSLTGQHSLIRKLLPKHKHLYPFGIKMSLGKTLPRQSSPASMAFFMASLALMLFTAHFRARATSTAGIV
jgi:hypothetical protein